MELKDNPLLQPEDFNKDYQQNIEALKNQPELVSFDKLCHEVFSTKAGKKLMSEIEERYLFKSGAAPQQLNFADTCVWYEGHRAAFLTLKNSIRSHDQRIKAGKS